MCTIISVRWIANAAARFSGTHGAVSAQARRADCSRQAIYDQARKVQDAVEADSGVRLVTEVRFVGGGVDRG